jgi:hypothetical protein
MAELATKDVVVNKRNSTLPLVAIITALCGAAFRRSRLSRRTPFVRQTEQFLEKRSGQPTQDKDANVERVRVIKEVSNRRCIDKRIANANSKQKNRLDYRYRDYSIRDRHSFPAISGEFH